jgi:N-acetylglucosamine-6-phosphate deacetylase
VIRVNSPNALSLFHHLQPTAALPAVLSKVAVISDQHHTKSMTMNLLSSVEEKSRVLFMFDINCNF